MYIKGLLDKYMRKLEKKRYGAVNKYRPHQGIQERARRERQLEAGIIKRSN